jgi:hypothetical protein
MFSGGEVEFPHYLFEEAIRLDPNNVVAWLWVGMQKSCSGTTTRQSSTLSVHKD